MLKNPSLMENNRPLTPFQQVQFDILWFLCRGFAKMPYWFRYYVAQNIIFFVLYYCLRYRMKVVTENLRNSFPEKSKQELQIIRRKFYIGLAEVFVDTVSFAGVPDEKALSMIQVPNIEEHKARVVGRDWIVMMAHYGCWEYGSFWGAYDPTQVILAVYHPLRNVVMDRIFQQFRSRHNTITVPMQECLRFFLRHQQEGVNGKKMAIGLVSDQNPPRRPDSHWFRFLNQDTLFFDGAEKLALRCGLPIYFVHMDRVRRGHYVMSFVQIYDGEEPVAENEITERYVRRLEAMIQARPELWMWSHRRWKHKR